MQNVEKFGTEMGEELKLDPLTILTLIQILIQIFLFINEHIDWNDLPFWKRTYIKMKLFTNFGFRANRVQNLMVKKMGALKTEEFEQIMSSCRS